MKQYSCTHRCVWGTEKNNKQSHSRPLDTTDLNQFSLHRHYILAHSLHIDRIDALVCAILYDGKQGEHQRTHTESTGSGESDL